MSIHDEKVNLAVMLRAVGYSGYYGRSFDRALLAVQDSDPGPYWIKLAWRVSDDLERMAQDQPPVDPWVAWPEKS